MTLNGGETESAEPLRWYITDRQRGKTTDLITWVKLGVKTTRYPFWSRIILAHSLDYAQRLRTDKTLGLDYHQVFDVNEWRNAHGHYLDDVEIGIDNVDILLQQVFVWRGKITRATATGDASRWPELITPNEPEPHYDDPGWLG